MQVDHNYAVIASEEGYYQQSEFSLAPAILSAVLGPNLERNDLDNNPAPVCTSEVQPNESIYTCNQYQWDVLFGGSSEEMDKHENMYCSDALKIYSCGKCGFVYKNEECLNEHLPVHDKEPENRCTTGGEEKEVVTRIIPVLFILKEQTNSNRNQEYATDHIACEDVQQHSKTWTCSSTQTENPVNDQERTCTESSVRVKKILNPTQQKYHLIVTRNLPVKSFLCLECGKKFSTRHLFWLHSRTHTNIYMCKKCDDTPTFQTCNEHIKHAQTVHQTPDENFNAKPIENTQRNICGKQFNSADAVTSHQTDHKTEMPRDDGLYNQCEKTFQDTSQSSDSLFTCNFCGQSFDTMGNLNTHTIIHIGEKNPFKCEVCGKSFQKKVSFENHKMCHSSVCNHECNTCGKMFRIRSSLRKHESWHSKSGSRVNLENYKIRYSSVCKYECNTCGKTFLTMSSLRKHETWHGKKGKDQENSTTTRKKRRKKEKYLNCDQCNKLFPDKTNLLVHQAAHSAEKNCNCDQCGKAFKTKYALQVHKKTHLAKISSVRYCCKMCAKHFMAVRYVKTHLKNFHPEALKNNSKGDVLYKIVINEHTSPAKKVTHTSDTQCPPKSNSVAEQESAVQVLQDLYMELPQITCTKDEMQQTCNYYVL